MMSWLSIALYTLSWLEDTARQTPKCWSACTESQIGYSVAVEESSDERRNACITAQEKEAKSCQLEKPENWRLETFKNFDCKW